MTKSFKKIGKTGNNIQLNYPKHIEDDYYIDMLITLVPKTSISIFEDNMEFIWEGIYNNTTIRVNVPKGTSAEFAKIEGLPSIAGLYDQVINEVKRILRQLN